MTPLRDNLPFWMRGPEVLKLADALTTFFQKWEDWLNEITDQRNPDTCHYEALKLMAHDRGVDRLPGEAEATWRGRVKHAITAALRSGSLAGMEAILTAHGVSNFNVLERQPGIDWDIVLIELDPGALSGADTDTIGRIIERWGRVCRRYTLTHFEQLPLYLHPIYVDEQEMHEVAA